MRTGGEKYRLCRTCQPLRVGLLARSTLRSDRRHTPRDVLPRSPGGSPQVRRVAAPGCWADGGWQDGGMRANLVRLVCVRRVRRLSDSSRHLARAARQVGRCQASMGVEHPRSAVPALWLSDPPLLCLCLAAEGRRIPHGLSGHQLRAPGLREPVCMPWSADGTHAQTLWSKPRDWGHCLQTICLISCSRALQSVDGVCEPLLTAHYSIRACSGLACWSTTGQAQD